MAEMVNHPSHYGGEDNPYECIKVCKAWLTPEEYRGALKFNVWRYTNRAGKKDPATLVEDHEKALWYQNALVTFEREYSTHKTEPSVPALTDDEVTQLRELLTDAAGATEELRAFIASRQQAKLEAPVNPDTSEMLIPQPPGVGKPEDDGAQRISEKIQKNLDGHNA